MKETFLNKITDDEINCLGEVIEKHQLTYTAGIKQLSEYTKKLYSKLNTISMVLQLPHNTFKSNNGLDVFQVALEWQLCKYLFIPSNEITIPPSNIANSTIKGMLTGRIVVIAESINTKEQKNLFDIFVDLEGKWYCQLLDNFIESEGISDDNLIERFVWYFFKVYASSYTFEHKPLNEVSASPYL